MFQRCECVSKGGTFCWITKDELPTKGRLCSHGQQSVHTSREWLYILHIICHLRLVTAKADRSMGGSNVNAWTWVIFFFWEPGKTYQHPRMPKSVEKARMVHDVHDQNQNHGSQILSCILIGEWKNWDGMASWHFGKHCNHSGCMQWGPRSIMKILSQPNLGGGSWIQVWAFAFPFASSTDHIVNLQPMVAQWMCLRFYCELHYF